MDPITAAVEIIGILIFLIWLIVPIREFKTIFRRLKLRSDVDLDQPEFAEPSPRAFPVIPPEERDRDVH
jgi:hypothetical protein